MTKAQQAAEDLIEEAREFSDETVGYTFKSDWDHDQAVPLIRRLTDALEAAALPESPDPAVIEAMAKAGALAALGVTAHTNERDREFARAAYAALRGAMQ